MVAHLDRSPDISPEDYLAWEEQQAFRHEYVNGVIYAMTGGTLPHNSIALSLASLIKRHLRGKGCRVFMNDVKVQVSRKGPYFYPDIVVTCDDRDLKSKDLISHPVLIIEVLSPSTATYDRGKKFRHYMKLNSLQEYVLISADTLGIECYRINENQRWELESYFPEDASEPMTIDFPCIEFSCAIDEIYEDVELDNEPKVEMQLAERLAERLRSLGIDPDEV